MKKIYISAIIVILSFSQNFFAQSWQYTNSGFNFILYDMSFPAGQSEVGYAVGSTVTYNGDGIILKTTDSGLTWTQISSGTIPGLEAVYFTSLNVGYAGGWQNYFIKTTDGGLTWTPQIIDPNIWYFNNIEFLDANNGVATTSDPNIFVTTNAGTTWTQATGTIIGVQDICYADGNTLFAVGGDEKITKSTDGGLSWTQVYSGTFTRVLAGVEFFNSDFGMAGGEDGKILVTTNGGTNWTERNASGFALWHGFHLSDLNTAYVVGTPEQIYKTTDGGITWVDDYPTSTYNYALYKIKFLENNLGIICGSQGAILRNTDNIIPVELVSFTADVNGSNILLNWSTATEINNSGFSVERKSVNADWTTIGFVAGSGTTTESRKYSYSDNSVSSGSYSYRLKQIDYDGTFEYSNTIEVVTNIPVHYDLDQNYPNPFNPTTTINYSLPEANFVTLAVYNSLGEKVSTLVNQVVEAGNHTLEFNAENLSSGIYFVRMEAGSFISTKKITLMK